MILFSLLVTIAYLGYTIYLFGTPKSISDTYYLLERRKKGTGDLFTFWTCIAGFPLLIAWLDMETYQPLVFAACGALMFLGTAAQFKEDLTDYVHYISAAICVTAALVWVILVGYWYIPLATFAICMPIAVWDRNWLTWVEIAALEATFIALLIM